MFNPFITPAMVLVILALFVGTFGLGYYSKYTFDKADSVRRDLEYQILAKKLSDALENIRVEYVTKKETVYTKGKTLIVNVPAFVDPTIMVNNGFIEHHNVSADNGVLGTVSPDSQLKSTVSLADAEKVISENYTKANACIEQVKSLQQSIKAYQADSEK